MSSNSQVERGLTANGQKLIIIGLGGPSSSGKTTVAKALHSILKSSLLIHLDDFYLPDDQIPVDKATNEQNWDVPEAIDFKKFINYINDLKSGKKVTQEIDTLEPEADLKLTNDEVSFFNKSCDELGLNQGNFLYVLVDGFMLYHDPLVADLFDIKLFFHASFESLKTRREARSGYNTVGGFWVDPPNYFANIVWPAYVKHHQYLFVNNDVNSELNNYAKDELKLVDFKNENNVSLDNLILWSLQQIAHQAPPS